SFSAGGDFEMIDRIRSDFDVRARMWKDGRDLVYNMVNCTKPVVAAIGGPAVGAGLVVALLADIPVAAESSFLMDGHTRLGVAAGDHAAIIWPLLCGMAKSKYYLMLCERLSAKEAEEIGLIAKCFPDEALYEEALSIATRLSDGPRWAIGWTKHALNGWLRMAMPTFDSAMALEIMGFTSPEAEEGLASLREKRAPDFRKR
ncbi:MAG: enoyl-CoA hydratase/isomerase family protein, partial [Alphaproteobacteria bacterium]|nr:enoyl-CoA hydratase/isomerase family protein [Alphaproteobacteria bacterium]